MATGRGTTVHLSLQGKGGVGQSLVASQYFMSKDRVLHAVDADPVNQTLAQYEALVVERLNLVKNGNVDQRAFDILMGRMLTEPGTFVVDTGASTFIPLWNLVSRLTGQLNFSNKPVTIIVDWVCRNLVFPEFLDVGPRCLGRSQSG
jgi:hypothetical protein